MHFQPWAAGSATQLQGTLSVEEGSGYVAGATVRLEVVEGRVIAEQPVSANGRFSFTDLLRRAYTLIATARGCETYVQQLDLTTSQRGRMLTIRLTQRLIPIPRRSPTDHSTLK